MDSILKLVYDHWYNRKPIPNGIHEVMVDHIRRTLDEKHLPSNQISQEIQELTGYGEHFAFRGHSNFVGYFKKHFPNNTMLKPAELVDDNSIYIYPLEVRTTLRSLYEDHTFSLDGIDYTYSFKDTLSPTMLNYLQTGRIKLVVNFVHDPISHSAEIYTFEKYMRKIGVDGKNIVLIAGNKYIEHNTLVPDSTMKLTYDRLLIQQCAMEMTQFPRIGGIGYVCDIVRESDLNPFIYRSKRFSCLNRTMGKPHRVLLAYFAIKHNLLKDSIFSFVGHVDESNIAGLMRNLYDLDDETATFISKKIADLIPYELDTHHLSIDKKTDFTTTNTKKEWYADSYVHITSETRFQDGSDPFFSEKTFRPIMNLQPFIYVGNHHSLELLQEIGFKTFAPFIDESYDLEVDPRKRILMIEREIEKLNNKSIEELHIWYYSITDILLHNQRTLESFKNDNPYHNSIKDIKAFYINERVK